MEVSSKTIARDMDFMRDRMLLPIEYDSQRHGFFYTREVESLPTIDISEGELLALSIARKAMDHYKGTPFEKPLNTALNKLSVSLPETITANLGALSESISFRQGGTSNIDDTVLNAFTRSALEKREIQFDYKKLGSPQPERRKLQTYHLTNYLGKWYAIGLDPNREAIRTFLLSRAGNCEITSVPYNVPKSFSADDYLGSSFGIYSPEGKHKVSIKFVGKLAEYVSENIWHPSQETILHEDGSLTVNFKLGSLVEVSSWVLSWGESAIALSPPELRKRIQESASKVLKAYQ